MKYKTVIRTTCSEFEEKKSRFIAHLVPVVEFDAVLQKLRAEHRKANHHVTAFRRMLDNGQIQEIGKDDGEPSGTSGMPVLKTMVGSQLMDAGIIVTRYFGGIKLGTGGLSRAYSAAARAVIERADLIEWVQLARKEISVEFHRISSVEKQIEQKNVTVLSRNFTELGVTMNLEGPDRILRDLV